MSIKSIFRQKGLLPTLRSVQGLFGITVMFLVCVSTAFGQDGFGLPKMRYEPVMPMPEQREPERIHATAPRVAEEELSATVLIPDLKGIIFIDSITKLKLITPEVHGIQYESDRRFAFAHTRPFERIVSKYLGRPFSVGDLAMLQREIQKFYDRNDLPVVGLFAPNQDVESGTIQLVLIEGRVGNIRFQGNRWFSSEQLADQMNIRRGRRIYESVLNEDLRWLNRSPFREVTVELQPGNDAGYCDMRMKVKDDFPVRGSIGYMDNGTVSTGIERVQFGVTHGNLWHKDHIANYTYNATPNFKNVQVHLGSYMIPFRNRDTLTVFGYYGTMIPIYELPIFEGEGKVWQLSMRYSKLLDVTTTKNTRREKRASIGYDFKDTNSNLDFGGIRVSDSAAQISQFVFGFSDTLVEKNGYAGYDVNLVWSPGKMFPNNNDESFGMLREDAQARYVYATLSGFVTRYLTDHFQWNLRVNGQIAGARLLPIEEMGLGGDGSVRGYNTYATNADSGWTLSNELATRFKPLGLSKLLYKTPMYCSARRVSDEYQLFTFLDLGGGWNQRARYYEMGYEELYGAGLGARYNFGPWVRLEAAYGWQLKDLRYNENYKDRAHIAVVISR